MNIELRELIQRFIEIRQKNLDLYNAVDVLFYSNKVEDESIRKIITSHIIFQKTYFQALKRGILDLNSKFAVDVNETSQRLLERLYNLNREFIDLIENRIDFSLEIKSTKKELTLSDILHDIIENETKVNESILKLKNELFKN